MESQLLGSLEQLLAVLGYRRDIIEQNRQTENEKLPRLSNCYDSIQHLPQGYCSSKYHFKVVQTSARQSQSSLYREVLNLVIE